VNSVIKKKVLIIEDNTDISMGFSMLINSTSTYEVISTHTSVEEAMTRLDYLIPDIILMDIDLPGMNGIEGTQIIKTKYPKIQLLIITVFENSERVFDALCAGASGYLTKNTKHSKLLEALDELCDGGAPMSTNIARMVINSFSKNAVSNPLTEKENKILQKLIEGKSYKTVAAEINLSIDTVKFHIKNIYIKLQVNSKEDAIAKARENKWF
jgi:DNA-binding NarL/FixJ family response regulator